MTRHDSFTGNTFRTMHRLITAYLAVSVLTLVAIVLLRGDPALVTPAVWIRAIIVVLTGGLLFRFAAGAERGSAAALRRRASAG